MTTKRTMDLLKPYLVGTRPHPNGDWDARCPLHEDKKRSARINFDKNVWHCFRGCGSGNLATLLRRMRVTAESDAPVERKQPTRGRVASVDPKIVERWHEQLLANAEVQEHLWSSRDISEDTIRQFKLGWDRGSQAFSIPVYLDDDSLFNVRMYRPEAPSDRKIWWHRVKDPSIPVPMFPANVTRRSDWVVLCEGEMDAIIATQYGFPAVSGTAGSGTWNVEWSESFRNKHVFICYDRDIAGERGARMVAEHLEPYAQSIYIVKIPINKKGADITDFFWSGKDADDFRALLRRSKRYQKRVTDPMKMDPVMVSVMDSFDSQNVGRAQGMDVLISGRAREPYALPKVVNSTCTMDAGPRCKFCPMLARNGEHNYQVPPSSPALLAMLGNSESSQQEALRKLIEAVKCDRLKHEIKSYQTVEQLYVRPSWDETSGDFTPRRINSVGKHNTMPSQVVHVTGTTWPDPKEQRNEFLAWDVAEAENAIDEFRVTADVVRDLKQFRPKGSQTPMVKLGDIAHDLEQHITRIYGRLDLHASIDLVYHSIIEFPFQGKLERRGWLDVLVVGDTRTGKSEVAARLLEHFGVGQLVNCEAATFAGVIGGVQQMADRQWAVTWGVIPMSDRRLVVLDEASGLSQEEIQKMSDVRSRGIIRMQKIQAEQAWARTRLVWLSNPRDKSMESYTHGVEAIAPLIGNREDIARFDFAMALTSGEVNMDQIYQLPTTTELKYSAEDCRSHILWAWSRKAEDVEWETGVEHDVLIAAEWLGGRYVSDPPLLQPANAHVKIARMAVAMASAVFSSDSSGKKVIVKREHVNDALKFLDHLYSKKTFGYLKMSERLSDSRERAVSNLDYSKSFLLDHRTLLNFLMDSHGEFRRDTMSHFLNISPEESSAIVSKMYRLGLVHPNEFMVKVNPVLHQIIREIEEERL